MTIKITKEDRRLQHICTDKDSKTYSIQGIHFNGKLAIATDGHGMAIKKKTSTVNDKTIKFPTPFSKKDVEYVDTLETDNKRDTAIILDGKFPDFRRVIRKATEKKTKFRIKFNAEVLYKLARALSANKDEKDMYIEMDISEGDERDTFVVKGSGPGIGILVPVFGGEPQLAPREILARLTTEDKFLNFVDDELEGKFITQENQDGP